MSTTDAPTYTQLDSNTQLSLINGRIRDLESQRLQLQLRIQAPAPGEVISDADTAAATELDKSLAYLRSLASSVANPSTSGGTTS